jgi:hypothetical protein
MQTFTQYMSYVKHKFISNLVDYSYVTSSHSLFLWNQSAICVTSPNTNVITQSAYLRMVSYITVRKQQIKAIISQLWTKRERKHLKM